MALVALAVAGVFLAAGIWNAWRDWRGPNRLIVPLCLDRTAMAQVFYDRGQGIRGEDCASTPVAGGGTVLRDVAFAVPRVPLRELRFDPMPFDGRFAVGAPRLESASGRVIAKFPLTAVEARNQIAGWRREGDHWSGAATPGGIDPQLTLALGAPLRVGAPRVPWIEALAVLAALVAMGIVCRHPATRGWDPFALAGAWLGRRREWLTGAGPVPVGAGALLVAAGQLWLLWPLHRTLDWPLWDEANYAARGAAWALAGGSLGPLHSSPFYVMTYAWFSHAGDLAAAIFAQHYFVKLASTVLLYFALARWWRSWPAAAAVALLWGATQFQLEFPLLVYQGAWVWFLAALVAADRWPLAALGLTVLAACGRQEYQVAAMVLATGYAWFAWRRHWSWRNWLGLERGWVAGAVLAAAGWALAAGVLMRTDLTARQSEERAWFAFEQHYAVRAEAAGEAPGINPWLDYAQVVQRDFPGAHSIGSAWRANAAAMLRHVRHNLLRAPAELADLGEPHAGLGSAAWLLLGGALLSLAGAAGAKRAGREVFPPSALLAAAALLAIAPGLFVLAKGAYLLALVPATAGAVGWLWLRLVRGRAPWGVGLAWIGALGTLAGFAALLCAPRVFVPGERPRPVAETVAVLREIWPATGRAPLLGVGASSYAHYLGDERCLGVEALAGMTGAAEADVPLARLLETVAPRAVLVTDDWRHSVRFSQAGLEALFAPAEWVSRDVPAGRVYLRVQH
jgi:hypothetical protein